MDRRLYVADKGIWVLDRYASATMPVKWKSVLRPWTQMKNTVMHYDPAVIITTPSREAGHQTLQPAGNPYSPVA